MSKSVIYTCTGDTGLTSLVGGKRVKKNDIRIEAYGDVDELNSQLGYFATYSMPAEYKDLIIFIQNKLFNIGAYLATDNPNNEPTTVYGLNDGDINRLETAIDAIDAQLPRLSNFVLPGGGRAAATAHVCRCVCRRCERRIISLSDESMINPLVLKFINRLSDLMFVLARFCNINENVDELFWNKNC